MQNNMRNNLIIRFISILTDFLSFFSSNAGDKPHHCELCGKKFALACNLRAHMKTHDDEPQEQCVRCGKDFLVASAEIKDGICRKCEDEPICVDEEEVEEAVTIRHKKFSNKLLSLPVAAH
jgi:hypothetical protein